MNGAGEIFQTQAMGHRLGYFSDQLPRPFGDDGCAQDFCTSASDMDPDESFRISVEDRPVNICQRLCVGIDRNLRRVCFLLTETNPCNLW